MSIGTITSQRNEIALMRKDMELDDEIAELNRQQGEMEETFRFMFTEITQQRLDYELDAKCQTINVPQVHNHIANLDLSNVDYVEWASIIEKEIEKQYS